MSDIANRRILVVDDNEDIHKDFRKILQSDTGSSSDLEDAEAALFGDDDDAPAQAAPVGFQFETESALQGQQALECVRTALTDKRPYALAFVDMRMPPGWDGVETIRNLWQVDPDLQVVVCTAFADYSWSEMVAQLGSSDRLLILKKPFDPIEVLQLATALTEKWNVMQRERRQLAEVVRAEQEARAYAASLETVNHALQASQAGASAAALAHSDLLVRMTRGLMGPIETLLDQAGRIRELAPPEEQWLEQVEELCRDGGQLMGTLHDVLDLSAIESGNLQTRRVECSPQELAERVLASWSERARERGVALELEAAGSLPERIENDPERLERILSHLVGNALKFTESGSVRLVLSAAGAPTAPGGGAPGSLVFRVEDTGCGISREKLSHLFEPFQEPDSAEGTGHGLGLSLCKRLAQALGGELSAESEPGSGSRFSLRLRLGERARSY